MSRPKSLLKETAPKNVIGEIAEYLAKHCGIPGCAAQFHLTDAQNIAEIIVNYNKNKKQGETE